MKPEPDPSPKQIRPNPSPKNLARSHLYWRWLPTHKRLERLERINSHLTFVRLWPALLCRKGLHANTKRALSHHHRRLKYTYVACYFPHTQDLSHAVVRKVTRHKFVVLSMFVNTLITLFTVLFSFLLIHVANGGYYMSRQFKLCCKHLCAYIYSSRVGF
jgi:hypothetical protein